MLQKKKIAICIPSRDIWKAKFGMCLAACLAYSVLQLPHDVIIINEKGSTPSMGRNKLVEKAINTKSDYILFVDDDMTFPHTALERLLKHDKPIVGCNAAAKSEEVQATGKGLDGKMLIPDKGLEAVKYLGFGCILIDTKVFADIEYPYFMEDVVNATGEDAYFCAKAREAGYEILCDHELSMEIGHIGDKEYKLL